MALGSLSRMDWRALRLQWSEFECEYNICALIEHHSLCEQRASKDL